MKVSGKFYKNIYFENVNPILKEKKIFLPFFYISTDFKLHNKILKENIAYDKYLNEYFLEEVLNKKTDKFYFYKINASLLAKKTFFNTKKGLQKANEFFEKNVKNPIYSMIFNELLINAYEHGNIGLKFNEKQELIEKGIYINTINILEKLHSHKKIEVEIFKLDLTNTYYITNIISEGEIFHIEKLNFTPKFNGRGLLIALKKSLKLFVAIDKNAVSFIIKEKNDSKKLLFKQ